MSAIFFASVILFIISFFEDEDEAFKDSKACRSLSISLITDRRGIFRVRGQAPLIHNFTWIMVDGDFLFGKRES